MISLKRSLVARGAVLAAFLFLGSGFLGSEFRAPETGQKARASGTGIQPRLVVSRTELSVGALMEANIVNVPSGANVSWDIDNERLAVVLQKENKCVLKALKEGTASVTATVGDWSETKNVTITKPGIKAKPLPSGQKEAGDKPAPTDSKSEEISRLLQDFEARLKQDGVHDRFMRQADEGQRVKLDKASSRRLQNITEDFFKQLADKGMTMDQLKRFKEQFLAANKASGESVLFPGQQAWDSRFLGTERAFMAGRTEMVEAAWKETLQDFFKANPNAVGIVYGRIDIGSWVKNTLGSLAFAGDIDFSSVSADPVLNEQVKQLFESKLRRKTSLNMVGADALLTAHGQATADVFIGEWGRNFAELDMLKRSSWSLIEVETGKDGKPVPDEDGNLKIREVKKRGVDLFWERAFRAYEQRKKQGLPPIDVDEMFPKMDLAKEPMLSLEMLRHAMHDIEHGPFENGQKIIKMLKYVDRSYFMNKKAVAEFGWDPYAENNPALAALADKVIKNKNDPAMIEELIRVYAGEDITAANVDSVVNKIVHESKIAMHDNSARSLAFRLNKISKMESEDARQAEIEKLWTDLNTELDGFRESGTEAPALLEEAAKLAQDMRDGKVSPEEMEKKAKQLHDLLNDAYKMPDSILNRIFFSDTYLQLRKYFREKLQWKDEQIEKFIKEAKTKFPRGGAVYDAVQEFNKQMEESTSGSVLMRGLDFADNAFTIYEAFMSGADRNDAYWKTAEALGRIGLQNYNPLWGIPLGIYDSYQQGSVKPAAMAVAFLYFPFIGQGYMVSTQLGRLEVAMRDSEFYNALEQMQSCTKFSEDGKIIGFVLKNSVSGAEIDSVDIDPPGSRAAIIKVFEDPESTFGVSPNFRYWQTLVPRGGGEFGYSKGVVDKQKWIQGWTGIDVSGYTDKIDKLKRFFSYNEDLSYRLLMLENWSKKIEELPKDKYTAQRAAALIQMENGVQRAIWVAMADALESAAQSGGKRKEWEEQIKKYEEALSLRDDDLGKEKGLLSRINYEIWKNSSLLKGENKFSTGLIFDRYLRAYKKVQEIRSAILFDLWNKEFDIDYTAAQTDPMNILLNGPASGAPLLTGDPDKDVAIAERCLAAHQKRGQLIKQRLADALGRELDPEKDKEHLRVLGQLAFEWEHLLDACPERQKGSGMPGVQSAMNARAKDFNDYLDKISKKKVLVTIKGDQATEAGQKIALEAVLENLPKGTPEKDIRYQWKEVLQKLAMEPQEKISSLQTKDPGKCRVFLEAFQKIGKKEEKLGEAYRLISVNKKPEDPSVTVQGAGSGTIKKPVTLLAEVVADDAILKDLVVTWSSKDPGASLDPAAGYTVSFTAKGAGQYTVKAELFRNGKTGKTLLAEDEHRITLKASDDKAAAEGGGKDKSASATSGDENPATAKKGTKGASDKTPGSTSSSESEGVWEFQKLESKDQVVHQPMFKGFEGSVGECSVSGVSYKKNSSKWVTSWSWSRPPASIEPGKTYPLNASMDRGDSSYPLDFDSKSFPTRFPKPEPGKYIWMENVGFTSPPEEITFRMNAAFVIDPSEPNICRLVFQFAYVPFNDSGSPWNIEDMNSFVGIYTRKYVYEFKPKGGAGAAGAGEMKASLSADSPVVTPGMEVQLKTSVQGGTAPYTYEWTGEGSGEGEKALFSAKKPGIYPVAVSVTDKMGKTAKTDILIEVRDIKVLIKASGLEVGRVAAGGKAGFTATAMAGNKDVTQAFDFQWQPHPEVEFTPFEKSPTTSARFIRPGQVGVWVQALQKKGARATAGESDSIEIEVIEPKLALSVTPSDPLVWDEVKARVTATPDMKELDFRWELPKNVKLVRESQNSRELSLRALDDTFASILARGRVQFYGDDLGEARGEFTARLYTVTVSAPKTLGPETMVWSEAKKGLVVVEKTATTFQDVRIKANIEPEPRGQTLTYKWTVAPEGLTLYSPASRETTANASQPGSYQVTVEVKNSDGVFLGKGSGQISIMAPEPGSSGQKAKVLPTTPK
jgi:hypothetical protein